MRKKIFLLKLYVLLETFLNGGLLTVATFVPVPKI